MRPSSETHINLSEFILDISSHWVERSLHVKFQLPGLPGSCSLTTKQNSSVKLEASLALAEGEVLAVAKADQYIYIFQKRVH
jgi:hypothetical protein